MKQEQWDKRRQNRIDRLKYKAQKASEKADEHIKKSDNLVSCIPFGQPILVGHHSERAHRNRLEKSRNHMFKSIEENSKASDYKYQAQRAEKNTAIFDDDPQAMEKLIRKLFDLQKAQDWMKDANKKLRKAKIDKADPKIYTKIIELGFTEQEMNHILRYAKFSPGNVVFPSYATTNNAAEIRRIKKRLEQLEQKSKIVHKEQTFGNIKIVHNVEQNRFQIFFPDKPDEKVRTELKRNGFRWSKYYGCWQRHLNNGAKWAAERALNIKL